MYQISTILFIAGIINFLTSKSVEMAKQRWPDIQDIVYTAMFKDFYKNALQTRKDLTLTYHWVRRHIFSMEHRYNLHIFLLKYMSIEDKVSLSETLS